MKKRIKEKLLQIGEITTVLMVFSFFFFVTRVSAVGEQYPVDEQVVIGEFVYDDDYVATTTDCYINIWAPYKDGNNELVAVVSNVLMSTSTTGWHYYNFNGSSTPGTWPATMSCGTASIDLVKGDKTFVLTTTTVVSDVASAVWNNTTRTLTDYATSSIADGIWSYPGRALDSFTDLVTAVWGNALGNRTLTALGSLAADVWNNTFAPDRLLSSKELSGGGNLATETYTDLASSTLATKIENASSSLAVLIDSGASLADIEAASSSLATLINTRASQTSLDNASTTIGGRFDLITTSTIATAVWDSPSRSLNNFTDLVTAVWGNALGNRTLTAFGSLAADIWNNTFAPDRLLSSKELSGGGNLATETYTDLATSTLKTNIDNAVSTIGANIENASSSLAILINAGASQADIEVASTSLALLINTRASQTSLDNASTTIGGRFDLITTSTIAMAVWDSPSRSLNNFTDLVTAVWGNAGGNRTITALGSVAADIWNNTFAPTRDLTTKQLAGGGNLATESYINMATSSLNTTFETASSSLGSLINTRASLSNQEAGWTVNLSDFGATVPEEAYQARLQILNYKSEPTAPDSAPTWVIYDPAGTPQAGGSLTTDSTGTYSYSFTVPALGVSGVWETVVTVVVGGQTLRVNDYWEVQGSPAHVSVDYMTDTEISDVDSNVTAYVTIVNEGLTWYEYHYEYCVVNSSSNACGGDDDIFYGTGSTRINPGITYNTTLTANNVTSVGTYYFKLIVYYGTDRSGASLSFPVTRQAGAISCGDGSCNGAETCSTCSADCGQCQVGGGGGGGGGGSTPPPVVPPVVPQNRQSADFNGDNKVNSIDFSILLAFWKTTPPFRSIYVDINKDNKVDSVDFSILMYQWGTKK